MTNYKEALEILKNRVSTLALNHKIGNREIANLEIKDIVTSIETWVIPIFDKALTELEQEQKLLELYKEISNKSKEIITLTRHNVRFWDLYNEIKEIQDKIKELEK